MSEAVDMTQSPEEEAKKIGSADIMRIMEMLPHRYPMLMIDRMLEMVPDERAVGLKNVSINENFFQGHFPSQPVMPGVLIVEAMAQTAGCLVVHTLGEESEGKLVFFMSIEDCRFRKPVGPGDALHVHVTKIQNRRSVWKFRGEAFVEGVLHAEATVTAMLMDKK